MSSNMLKLFLFLLLLSITTVEAVQFSATAVMSAPNMADSTSRIYFSPKKIRKEFFYYGEPVIQILDSVNKVSLMCFSDQQVCYQNALVEDIDIGLAEAKKNPCSANKKLHCENLGEEVLNKRKAVKWKLSSKNAEGEIIDSSYLWVDSEINIPVKNLLNNQTTLKLVWLGNEVLGERKTQKWHEVILNPNQPTEESQQWFDTELKISIKQSYPDGRVQELKNISVEAISDQQFQVPFGFTKKIIKN